MPNFLRSAAVLFLVLGLSGCNCGGGDGQNDAGPTGDGGVDAGQPDAGQPDAGQPDAGQPDAGQPDAGQPDAGQPDAGQPDAGQPDAGQPDAGQPDAGPPDAGPPARDDAGCPLPTGLVLDASDAGLPSAGLRLWLRADTAVATLDGGAVCRWEDVSGHGYHFTPGNPVPPFLTSAGLRGRPSVSFPAVSRFLSRSGVLDIAPDAGRTIAVISLTHDTTHRWQPLIMGAGGTPGTYVSIDMNTFSTTGSKEGVYVTNNAYDADLATSTAARTHVMSIESMVPGGDILSLTRYAVDGTLRTLTRTAGGLGNTKVENFSGANFTAVGAGYGAFTGAELGDVLVYERALTDGERAQVEAYFNARYPP